MVKVWARSGELFPMRIQTNNNKMKQNNKTTGQKITSLTRIRFSSSKRPY